MSPLPIDVVLPEILTALSTSSSLVIQAPTGSGKSTRLPLALLEAGLAERGTILLLQPRRVAARACARRMAQLLAEPVGKNVGYQVRFERQGTPETRIWVMTEGILTRRLLENPTLDDVALVILDEFHERSIHSDLALALLRELQSLRGDLKLLVMSATLDAGPVAAFLGCPIVTALTRGFPVVERYLDLAPSTSWGQKIEAGLNSLLADPGDDGGQILAFLPGAGEIAQARRHLSERFPQLELLELHGSLSSEQQDLVFQPARRRRLILATNIAETSLTIEGVTAVIDSGFVKLLSHDPTRGLDRLDRTWISQASAAQRAGRAGRTGPGRVVRLWRAETQALLAKQELPEIARIDLSGLLLQVLDFHGPDLDDFGFFEPPPPPALERARHVLALLGAVDSSGRLSPRGRRIASLPLHPRLGAVLEFAARHGWTQIGARLSALLEEQAPRGDYDLAERLKALQSLENRGPRAVFEDPAQPFNRRLIEASRQLYRLAERLAEPRPRHQPDPQELTHQLTRMLLSGFPDRVCAVRQPGLALMVGGRGIAFEPGAIPHSAAFFLALEVAERGQDRTAGKASVLHPCTFEDLEQTLEIRRNESAVWDHEREAAVGVRQWCLGDLVLREAVITSLDPQLLAQKLAQKAALEFERLFQPEPVDARIWHRLRLAKRLLNEEAWPAVELPDLIEALPTICRGLKRFEDLRRFGWRNYFEDLLEWRQRQLLDKELPDKLEVPSGSAIAIDYEPALGIGGQPVLAVRLQELFGWAQTPRLARGRLPLLIHLLGPNFRPVQVTSDLAGFWNGTYAEVRKELRQRYPKHSWPEDPWNAPAVRGAQKKPRT